MMVSATRQIARGQRDSSATTESAQAEVRPLGSLEHLFWLLDQHHFVHFAVTALISGGTSRRDWRRALDRLQKRHPIFSVCIDGEPDSVPSFRQADAKPIPLRIVEDEPELHWEAEVEKELATPFNPSRAPLIRAVLIQGARGAAFMLVAHHSIADGLSLAYAIRDTLDALAGRFLPPLPWLPSEDDMLNVSDSLVDGQLQDQAGAARPAIYRPHLGSLSFDRQFGPVTPKAMFGPAVLTGLEGQQTIGVATVNGALCLLHTSHTPPEGLLEKIQNVLAQACDERA
jgi:hypothetical protein